MDAEPPKVDPPKRKRRWFQFSLRTLMIFTLVVAVACAWLGRKIEQKRREREAVTAIVKLGGEAHYDYQHQLGSNGEPQLDAKPTGPDWLRSLLGENFFNEVVFVPFESRVGIGDSALEQIEPLTELK